MQWMCAVTLMRAIRKQATCNGAGGRSRRSPAIPARKPGPNSGAMDHGGGMTWLPGTYDPELNLLYWGTGNANPVFAGQSRKGSNLWTASIVALDPDKGKLVWWFQASPHDTHDWDNVETPVLFDAVIDGKPRKLLAQAARCGWFFVLDRTNGKNLVSKPFSGTGNWAKGVDAKGQPVPDPMKEPQVEGSMIDMPTLGRRTGSRPATIRRPSSFIVNGTEGYGLAYLYDTSESPQGYGGGSGGTFDSRSALFALNIHTGNIAWKHELKAGEGSISGGVLTTAGKLLFTGDSGSLVAFDPANGKILWHHPLASGLSNGPSTYMLDGKQQIVAGAGDSLYAFTLGD